MSGTEYLPVEQLLAAWLGAQLSVGFYTELPANIASSVPLIQVVDIGGTETVRTFDEVLLDVETFAIGRAASRDLSAKARHALRYVLPGQRLGTGVAALCDVVTSPRWLPWDQTDVRRFGATYRVVIHAA
jgi:hypothetical protein